VAAADLETHFILPLSPGPDGIPSGPSLCLRLGLDRLHLHGVTYAPRAARGISEVRTMDSHVKGQLR